MHCSKASHPQHWAKDGNTANEEVSGSQQCLQEDKTRCPPWHPDRAALSKNTLDFSFEFTLFRLGSRKWSDILQEIFTPEKAEMSLLVWFCQLLSSASCQVVAAQFVFFPCRAFLVQLHLINLSQHQERNNKMKKKGDKLLKVNIVWQCNSLQ